MGTVQTLLTWTVAEMDDGIIATFATKTQALAECRSLCDDGRKMSGCRRAGTGLYEYTAPARGMRLITFSIGTREALIKGGFGEAIEAYERDEPYGRDRDWNRLAAPLTGRSEQAQ